MRTKILAVGIALSASVSPVIARHPASVPDAPGPILWQGLRSGMTPREVQRQLPRRQIRFSSTCTATAKPVFLDGQLVRVSIAGRSPRGSLGLCADEMRRGLEARYGRDDWGLEQKLMLPEAYPSFTSPLAALNRRIEPERYAEEAWSLPDISVLFLARRGSGEWSVTYVATPTALPPTSL